MNERIQELAPERAKTHDLTFDYAIKIAHGCFDYTGGYHDDRLYIYHHGIQTVVNCLETAKEKGLKDSQIRAVHIIGTQEIEREMKQPEQKTCDDILAPEQSAMCANDIEHFHAYAKEFILPITLKSLIESHKKLCRISQIKNDEWLKELAAATELGRKQGLEFVTEHEFVSVEKLKSMTINELVFFLYDGV